MGNGPRPRARVLTSWPPEALSSAMEHVSELAKQLPGSLVFLRAGELEADRVVMWEIVEVANVRGRRSRARPPE